MCALRLSLAGLLLATPFALDAAGGSLRERADGKAAALVAQLTLDEKVEQLLNTAPAIPRLDIPAYNWWTESLHGAMGAVPTTNFPEPIGLAASFDKAMLHEVAAAIGTEVRALHALARRTGRLGRIGTGLNTWSPNINIFRDPRWGRGQETYGEDPFLTARLGVAYVRGMQGDDADTPQVIASPKHFAVHSGPESTRHRANVFVSPYDLEDTYLPAFRAAIVEGEAGSIMCAYNRVNGQPACGSDLLLIDKLRGAWNFDGYMVSDCDAVRDIEEHHHYAPDAATAVAVALKAGVDSECNGQTLFDVAGIGLRYHQALARGLITEADIDRALVRLFSARYRTGDLPGVVNVPVVESMRVLTQRHDGLALHVAEKSLVLLKNNGILPLKPDMRIAVIGPHGDSTRVLRGNYSSQLSLPPVSVEAGLRQAMPQAQVRRVPFGASITDGDSVPESALLTPQGKPGLRAEYFNAEPAAPTTFPSIAGFMERIQKLTYAKKPVVTRTEPGVAARAHELAEVSDHYRVVWSGYLVAPETGVYRIGLSGVAGSLELDGKTLSTLGQFEFGTLPQLTAVTLREGHRYPIRVESEGHALNGVELLWKHVSTSPEADLKAAAAQADVLVAVVGLTANLEGEEMKVDVEGFSGGDKTSLDLPADQRQLLQQAQATGKPLVVVSMNGSPVDFSWARDNADALIEAWYPGQSGGLAVANVLSGKTNPAGRLPLTLYRSVADLPPFDDYSMRGRTYRYFEGSPVYPFGFGLSYTRFEYGPLQLQPVDGAAENGLRVTTQVANVGDRDGEEVAQLYLTPPAYAGAPKLALRGFERVLLKAGEKRTLHFDLSPRDLSFVRPDGVRELMQGHYTASVGAGQPGAGPGERSATFVVERTRQIPE